MTYLPLYEERVMSWMELSGITAWVVKSGAGFVTKLHIFLTSFFYV